MTRELMALGVAPTGWTMDPNDSRKRRDPYWQGEALRQLLDAMKRHFRR